MAVSLQQYLFRILVWSQFLIAAVMSFQKAGRLARRIVAPRTAFLAPPRVRPNSLSIPWTTLWGTVENKEEVDPGVVEGTDLTIVKYPHPALRHENAEITPEELKDGSIAKLAKEMLLVMYAAEGVGLAAPQVGVNKRLMVYNEWGDKTKWLDEMIMVNPTITTFSENTEMGEEGCLSFPDMGGEVDRHKWIKVEAVNLKGKKVKRKFTGWEARIFQHEYDHLDGTVYVDRLTEEGRKEVQPRLDELIDEFGEGGAL
jgi:peptide deformylase